MMTHEALNHFRGRERYNCAQALFKTFAPGKGADPQCLEQFQRCGGGRAPGGECGALFAAKTMLRDKDARRELEQKFVEAAGSNQCRAIRKLKHLSCKQCVLTAADELSNQVARGVQLQAPPSCST